MQAETRSFSAVLAALALLICAMTPGAARAQSYDLSVTRTAGDFYKVLGKDIVIQTRRCDVVATAKNSVFTSDGHGAKLVFADGGQDCDVKAAYGPTIANPGEFKVTVSHDADDWYEVFGASTYIKTSSCAQPTRGEQATLSLGAANAGQLVFGDGTSCMVEGVYDKLRI
jgi:hypothetical protein